MIQFPMNSCLKAVASGNPCDKEQEDIHFLINLQCEKELYIYDDTLIPFSGKVTIADTDGCALARVTVCARHNNTSRQFDETCLR